jgi:RNA polymerase sigma-70 factor (ECF subfamily)
MPSPKPDLPAETPEDRPGPTATPAPRAAPRDRGAELMLAWQAGDETAFDRLVELTSGQVYALLTRFLGPHPAREDLTQEVFLRVVRSKERYVATARFTTWLYRIVFNIAVNHTQRRPPKATSLDGARDDDEGVVPQVQDEGVADPGDGLARQDVVDAVQAAIDELPEKQRMALVLAKYEDMPYVQIADVLGSTEKAIKSLVHRARENLRASLAPWMETEGGLA